MNQRTAGCTDRLPGDANDEYDASRSRGMRVVLCEPDPEVRAHLRSLIARNPMLTVVAQPHNWSECERKVEDLLPEILIVRPELIPENWTGHGRVDAFPIAIALLESPRRSALIRSVDPQLDVPDVEAVRKLLDQTVRMVYDRKLKQLWDLMHLYVDGLQAHSNYPSVVRVDCDGKMIALQVQNIMSVVAARRYVSVHTTLGRYTLREPIHQLASKLDPAIFIRIHRSIIVNSRQLDYAKTTSENLRQAVLLDGSRYSVGPNHRDAFATLMNAIRAY